MELTHEQIHIICKGNHEIANNFHALLGQHSSKPPSSDGLRKPTNLRQPGDKCST
ncbi:hypothetical protein SAMN04487969_14417 [Paenibacillus algorifonticola]|uniref:Uncharacterized protein n=1 Tax=Paenibacillus algorifonticola TaxID=684063 RepID=A0A1I2IWA2_9BACL|nr:hypothetical protein SAMN04487969_14417 [Paenibacillus algorifonticola]